MFLKLWSQQLLVLEIHIVHACGGNWQQPAENLSAEKRSVVFDAQLVARLLRLPLHPGEADEDLLQRRLTDRVVLDVVLRTIFLYGAKQARPRQARRAPDLVLHQPVMLVLELAGGERRAYELLQGLCLRLQRVRVAPSDAQLDDQRVTLAELGLDMLIVTETLELTVDHHRHPRTQRLTLLHAGSNNNKRS